MQINTVIPRYVPFSFALTNARSLCNKTSSLCDHFNELTLNFVIVTETWFNQGPEYEAVRTELEHSHGLGMISNMKKKKGRTNPGGGVSILCNKTRMKLAEHKIKRGRYEIVTAKGKIPNNTRVFISSPYMCQPNFSQQPGKNAWTSSHKQS